MPLQLLLPFPSPAHPSISFIGIAQDQLVDGITPALQHRNSDSLMRKMRMEWVALRFMNPHVVQRKGSFHPERTTQSYKIFFHARGRGRLVAANRYTNSLRTGMCNISQLLLPSFRRARVFQLLKIGAACFTSSSLINPSVRPFGPILDLELTELGAR